MIMKWRTLGFTTSMCPSTVLSVYYKPANVGGNGSQASFALVDQSVRAIFYREPDDIVRGD